MSLRERLGEVHLNARGLSSEAGRSSLGSSGYVQLKIELHKQLLDRIDLEVMGRLGGETGCVKNSALLVERLIIEQGAALNAAERKQIVADIENEVLGLGPLEALLRDPTVSDILVNGPRQVYVERRGRLELTGVRFDDDAHLMKIIDKIVSRVGRRIDESSPMVDARLPDGSRVNAVIPPLALDGPMLSIRKFAVKPLRHAGPAEQRHADAGDRRVAGRRMVAARLNVLISGGTGTGKTTLLNVLSGYIPHDRARRDDRGRGGTAAAAAARRAAGNAAAEHRRQGRDHAARAGAQCAADAAGPDHRRRGARRRGVRHAAGDEHRPRRLDEHRARQHGPRRAGADREHARHVRDEPAAQRDAPADRVGDPRRSSRSRG